MTTKIKVLVVDDSAVVRQILTRELSKYHDIEIIGEAVDPYEARDKIVKLKPAVITLDLEMPRMDGLSFLRKLMKHYPLPVVVLSSLTPQNSKIALQALDLGAVEVLCKPGSSHLTYGVPRTLINAIRAASRVQLPIKQKYKPVQTALPALHFKTGKILAIGASTGGVKAVEAILSQLPPTIPATIVVQHMPAEFTTTFASRLNETCQMEVREATHNDRAVPGLALIAPGNKHILLKRRGADYYVIIKDGPRVHYQRPSVDVLFRSVAKHATSHALGVILTGMGADGAKGLLAMHTNGAPTIAQSEETCAVFGMPREAIKLGAVDYIVPLPEIARQIINIFNS